MKKILFSLLAVISMLFATTVKADTAPTSFNIKADDLYFLYGSQILGNGSTLNFRYKVNSDGQIVYCTEIHDAMPTSGSEKYTLSKVADPRIAYVLLNGYPNKQITGDKNKDYYITGLAIWYLIAPTDSVFTYFDLEKGTYKGSSSLIVQKISELVKKSEGYTYKDATLDISNANSNMTLSSDKKYYESSQIAIKTSGNIKNNEYKVSLENAPKGTIITDTDGNTKDTFKTSDKFIVKVPVSEISTLSSQFTVKVTTTSNTDKAYIYAPSNEAYQKVVTLYSENKELTKNTTLKISTVTKVEISKKDSTTEKELPGAKLTVKDAKGKVIDKWVSTDEPHVIEGLSVGKYTLTEETAPEGYVLSTEEVDFEIKADGTVTKVVMYNKPKEEKKAVYISKQDVTTKEEIAGAHLEIWNEAGELVEAWVSDTTSHAVYGLEPGKYTLIEKMAPEGYELSEEKVEFVVKEDGTVGETVIMYNTPETIVPVPSTSSFKTITASLIGIIIVGFGSFIILKNLKKNENK